MNTTITKYNRTAFRPVDRGIGALIDPVAKLGATFPATAILAIAAARVDDGLVSLASVEVACRETEYDLRGLPNSVNGA